MYGKRLSPLQTWTPPKGPETKRQGQAPSPSPSKGSSRLPPSEVGPNLSAPLASKAMTTLPAIEKSETNASTSTLASEYNGVWACVHDARKKLTQATCPFDTMDEGALELFREERGAALEKLRDVEDYLMDLAFHYSCQASSNLSTEAV